MSQFDHGHSQGKTLSEWLCYLEQLHSQEIDLGLDRIGAVAKRMALDLSFARVITVAGTNGKGTTCAFLENALLDLGYSVAVYSSPHIERFNERLRINKADVIDDEFIAAFELVEQMRAEISLTYYEFTTLAALWLLMQKTPQMIILEVGLGGRLDATNIVDADIAVLTTIDLDHQAFLGNDRESIGFEKAGIMRGHRPAVIGDIDAPASVLRHGENIQAELYCRQQQFSVQDDGDNWHWRSEQYQLSALVPTRVPRDNVATALMVLQLLQIQLNSDRVNRWIEHTQVPGRMEHFNRHCEIVLDVGHNPQAARYLAKQMQVLRQQYPERRIFAVVGMLADKDIVNSLAPLLGIIDTWYVGSLHGTRAAKAEQLLQALLTLQQAPTQINCFDNVTGAFKMASQDAKATDLILVFGSFYTVAEVRALLA